MGRACLIVPNNVFIFEFYLPNTTNIVARFCRRSIHFSEKVVSIVEAVGISSTPAGTVKRVRVGYPLRVQLCWFQQERFPI
jgi:hypothetical protein